MRSLRARSVMVAVILAIPLNALAALPGAAAEVSAEKTACIAEAEPNDRVEEAPLFTGELCVQGSVVEVGDVDLLTWEVAAADAATTWTLSLTADPTISTTARVSRVESAPGTDSVEVGAEVASIEVDGSTEGAMATTDLQLEAGRYVVAVSREDTADTQPLADGTYELRIAVAGEASLAGDTTDAGPGVGRIAVVAAEGASLSIGDGVAVELLLDTSGSMLEPLGDSTRIKVAERTLVGLVDGTLPEGLPVALRTFKAKAKACSTDLQVPLQPLDRPSMTEAIRDLSVKKGTRTPIAKMLSKVPKDMEAVTGHRIVVLVTDGEENCDGDPAAEIVALTGSGTTATVNIVGYALGENEELKTLLATWADLGGGSYFDAPDRAALEEAMKASLMPPYLVFDETGTLVATGRLGDAGVEIAEGVYRVEVLSDPPVTFDAVTVEAAGVVELTAGEAG